MILKKNRKMKNTRELLNNLLKGIPVSENDKLEAKVEIEIMERDIRDAKIGIIVYKMISLALASLLAFAL